MKNPNYINSWKSHVKQSDKYQLLLRLGRITLLEIQIDISDKKYRLMFMNFGIGNYLDS